MKKAAFVVLIIGVVIISLSQEVVAADTLYKCDGFYQNQPCSDGEKGRELKNLPKLSRHDPAKIVVPEVEQSTSATEDTVDNSARARLPFPGERTNRVSEDIESRFMNLEMKAKNLKAKTRNFRGENGRSINFQATRLITESLGVCTPELFEQGATFKTRCQDVKRMLAEVARETKAY